MSRIPSLSGTRRSSSSARLARDIPISSDNSHRPAIDFENDSDNKYDNKECRVGIDLEEGELGVDFDGRKITYGFGELDELVLAYATTNPQEPRLGIPAVVIPLTTQHYPMLQRNLVYTGVTRGK
jgi:ATP-dependent exoDNAse (exonuclease V) alpha subunit